jgi:TonB family protein
METFGLYLLKSAVWLTGFTLVFLTVLRNERYFQLNRIYLLSGIIASIAFPLYTWHYAVIVPSSTGTISISGITAQVIADPEPAFPFYWWFYAAGLGWLAFRLIWQTVKVIRKLRKTGYEVSGPVKLVRTSEYAASFSFFSFVFVNPSTSDVETREIVNHESEHIVQRHWFDLLLVEVLCMLQWFNPFVWVYAHLIRQNHEYLADEKALQRTSNPAIYQATLLNQLLGVPVISLANSFSYSLNKKRFKMMKKSIHSPFRKLRLLLILPLMALVFYAFAKPEYITIGSGNIGLINDRQDTKQCTIKGKVVDPDGKPLAGAAVVIKNSSIGTITDNNGNFELKDVPEGKEIMVSYVGYQTVQARADAETAMTIKMVTQSFGIDKVVVVGYGERQSAPPPPPPPISLNVSKGSKNPPLYFVDGAIVTSGIVNAINPESIQSIKVVKDQSAITIYGEAAKNGVVEITLKKNWDNGTPKADTTKNVIRIRGNSVLNSNGNPPPLILLDGVVIDKKQMDAFSPDKIQSISVLKDKSATALYGEKGKDGVILITSKNSSSGFTYSNLKPGNSFVDHFDPQHPPLYVLDDIIVAKTDAQKILAVGVESVNILKDNSATQKYGEKGKYGVVEMVTKKNEAMPKEAKLENVAAPGYSKQQKRDKEPFTVVEQMPEFPGGQNELMKFIGTNVRYPNEAKAGNIQGMVLVNFIVGSSGKVEKARVVKSVHQALDAEALRVIGLMPDWKPGKQNGKAVDVAYTIPIQFALKSDDKKSPEVTAVGYRKTNPDGQPYVVVEQMPQFPGGEKELMKFIGDNVKYPAQAAAEKAQGTVIMTFVVRSDGKVDQLNVERGVHPALDAEATRVLGLMPAWSPGVQGGKPVDVAYTVPIQFKLQ